MEADPRGVVMHLIRATEEGDKDLRDFLAEEVIRHLERGDELEAREVTGAWLDKVEADWQAEGSRYMPLEMYVLKRLRAALRGEEVDHG
jgi:hypothetical protein